MKIFLLTLLTLIIATSAASGTARAAVNGAVVLPPVTSQVCEFYTGVSHASTFEGCTSDMISATTHQNFVGFRLPPMPVASATPINKTFTTSGVSKNYCFYLTNTSHNTYFIPSGNQAELDSFFAHMPQGIAKVDCAQPAQVSVQDRCGGMLFTTLGQPYAQGFQALSYGRAGIDVRTLYAVDATGRLLRVVTAQATKNGWAFSYNQPCPSANGQASAAPAAAAPAFNRNSSTSTGTITTIGITDGALIRHISG